MGEYQLIAATGRPTGIAHTYIAQEALEQAARRRDIKIKVEIHGQIGIESELTVEEIRQTDIVIIAVDKDVHSERFAGKRIIDVSVSTGIKDIQRLIDEALAGKDTVLADNEAADTLKPEAMSGTNFGRSIYKNLMDSISHTLPFVVVGGVLITISLAVWGIYPLDPDHAQYNATVATVEAVGDTAIGMMVPVLVACIAEGIAKRPGLVVGFVGEIVVMNDGTGFLGGILAGFLAGYLILFLQKLLTVLPKQLGGLKAIFLYPVIGVAFIGIMMSLLVGPVKVINEGMMSFLVGFEHSNPLVLGAIVGCMCALDMGGPINKAAYVTGTALLAQGNTTFMVGMLAACIAPPLITDFATLLFGKYFDTNDHSIGLANFILGSTHITEGAIPFAAKDPVRMLPTMMLGSPIAAILTYSFGAQAPAPYSGFLVLPVVTGKAQRVTAILTGSIVGGVVLGLIQKRRVTGKDKKMDNKAANRIVIEKERAGDLS